MENNIVSLNKELKMFMSIYESTGNKNIFVQEFSNAVLFFLEQENVIENELAIKIRTILNKQSGA